MSFSKFTYMVSKLRSRKQKTKNKWYQTEHSTEKKNHSPECLTYFSG